MLPEDVPTVRLGTNRWAVKVEAGYAYPFNPKWILELELLPLADDHAQGGGEALVAEAALVGDSADELVVGLFEVDHAGDVLVWHRFAP